MALYRNVAPVDSFPPAVRDADKAHAPAVGTRGDGRPANQLRAANMRTGVVRHAAGSAYFEIGETKVLCSVFGPRPSKREFHEAGEIECTLQLAPFAAGGPRREYGAFEDEKEAALVVQDTLRVAVQLDKFPKSILELQVLVLVGDAASCVGASICCAALALVDAGIEMLDMVSCCTVALVDDRLLLDPTREELARQAGSVTLALLPELDFVANVVQTGQMSAARLGEAIALGNDGCKQMAVLMRRAFA